MALSGGRTQSKGETLDLLLVTHFPNSVVIEGSGTHCCQQHHMLGLAGGCKGGHLWESGMGN